jgi:anaphase-promoting complex subunit 3
LGHLERGANLIYPFLCIIQKNGEALELLEQAIVADPKNPLPKYQKANVLMSEERYHDALAELEQLKEVAPRESSVYFLMGKIYKRLDMLERAIYHFCIALDLKPSASDVNLIKTAIEKLPVADDLEDENL